MRDEIRGSKGDRSELWFLWVRTVRELRRSHGAGAKRIEAYIDGASDSIAALKFVAADIARIAEQIIDSLEAGGTVFWMGNGGSASDAQHLAAELIGRFERDRAPLRSIALSTDTSVLTALANDFGFETIFERQVEALMRPGDVAIGISTSGTSQNVLRGLTKSRELGAFTALLTGSKNQIEQDAADLIIQAPSDRTCHIQECHIVIGQAICEIVEAAIK